MPNFLTVWGPLAFSGAAAIGCDLCLGGSEVQFGLGFGDGGMPKARLLGSGVWVQGALTITTQTREIDWESVGPSSGACRSYRLQIHRCVVTYLK